MKSPQPKPEPTPKGLITDKHKLLKLVSGSGWDDENAPRTEKRWVRLGWVTQFWEQHAPELVNLTMRAVDGADAQAEEYRAFQRRRHERVAYLLDAGLLAGEALRTALQLEAAFERARERDAHEPSRAQFSE